MKKYVLTGGPCTGKTTTLNALMQKGFKIIPEIPRIIIEQQQMINGEILPWKNISLFQVEVLKKQIELESEIQAGTIAFLDRGVVDALAYCRFYGIDAPAGLIEAARDNRYNGVFFLDMLPNYEVDSVRKEDLESARKIHQTIREIYSEFDYEVVEIPPLSVAERINLILSKI